MGWTFLLPVLLAVFTSDVQAGPLAHTAYGTLEGKTLTLNTGVKVDRWHSIPYAKPPLADLRWRPPNDPEPWNGIRVANRLPNSCPQSWGLVQLTHQTWTRYNEDCLYLNIYAPNAYDGAPYPVMVYFHGGAYAGSSSIQYPGHFVAAKGVVVAVVNYRLGMLGFMSTNDEAAPGNYGLLDMIKALKFVNDNIGAFGGDVGKITIAGQSAGGASVGLFTLSPKTQGMFHQAITQSGTEQAIWAINHPDSSPHLLTYQVAAQVNCTRESSAAMMDCLRAVDVADLRAAKTECKAGYFCLGFTPVVDGPGGVLPKDPWTLRSEGHFAKVPLLTGINSDDGSLYTFAFIPESLSGGFNRSEFIYHLREDLISLFSPQFNGTEEDVVQLLQFFYAPWPNIEDKEANREMFNVIVTDAGFSVGVDAQLKSQAEHVNNTYSYIFGYGSSKAWMIPDWIGIPHIADLPYAWGYPLLKDNFGVRYDTGMLIDIIQWDDEDRAWADYFITLWTNFVKYGNPTAEPVPHPDSNTMTDWPAFSFKKMNHLRMDRNIRVQEGYRQLNIALWKDYAFKVAGISWLEDKSAVPQDASDRPSLQQRMDVLYRKLAQAAIDISKPQK